MINGLCFLGIYEDAINSAIEKAESLMKHEDFDFDISDIDEMNEWALEYLKECGSFEDITNSIILAYFSSTEAYIKQKYPDADIDYYVNCMDSYLIYKGEEV